MLSSKNYRKGSNFPVMKMAAHQSRNRFMRSLPSHRDKIFNVSQVETCLAAYKSFTEAVEFLRLGRGYIQRRSNINSLARRNSCNTTLNQKRRNQICNGKSTFPLNSSSDPHKTKSSKYVGKVTKCTNTDATCTYPRSPEYGRNSGAATRRQALRDCDDSVLQVPAPNRPLVSVLGWDSHCHTHVRT
jgi:hypothetical protein